jgi:tricorn protease
VNQLDAIFLYSLETHKSTQVTDGMSDASSPAFDLNGKYLYFLASTDDGPSQTDSFSGYDRAQSSAAYVVVLAKDGASPIPPESDDEKARTKPRKTRIRRTTTRTPERKTRTRKIRTRKPILVRTKIRRIPTRKMRTRRTPTSQSK